MAWNRRYSPTRGGTPSVSALIPRQKGGQGGADMGVPAGLGPGQGPGVAAQIGQMRRKSLRHAHGMAPSAQKEKLRTGTYASQKSSLACRNLREIRTFGTLGRELHGVVRSATRTLLGVAATSDLGQVWQDMTQQWETTVANEEKPNEKARAIRARQRAIGRELRRMYDDVAQEPVPGRFHGSAAPDRRSRDAKAGRRCRDAHSAPSMHQSAQRPKTPRLQDRAAGP